MHLDDLWAQAAAANEVTIPEGWGQGRATFGGLVAGLLAAKGLAAFDLDESTLRALTTSFVAPTEPGPARLETTLLRAGRAATQIQVSLVQGDQVRATQLASYGQPRDSAVSLPPSQVSVSLPPEACLSVPHIEGITPDFLGHLELLVATGQFPFSGSKTGDLSGYMRYREAPAKLTLPDLVTLADAWPPATSQCLPAPATMSTMTWTLELIDWPLLAGDHALAYDVHTDVAGAGYAHTHARIGTQDGDLIALSRQTIAMFG